MTDLTLTRSLLTDSFERIRELVTAATEGAGMDVLSFRPDQDANTVGWLVWHLSRVQDDHVADAAGVDQVWPVWRDRFGLPFDDFATGYGQTAADVAEVKVSSDLLIGYHADVNALTQTYLDGLTETELERVVDERWDPPVTVSIRLVSVIGDCLQHLGQAAYVRGLAERRSND